MEKVLENPKKFKEPISYLKKDDLEKLDISVPLKKKECVKALQNFILK